MLVITRLECQSHGHVGCVQVLCACVLVCVVQIRRCSEAQMHQVKLTSSSHQRRRCTHVDRHTRILRKTHAFPQRPVGRDTLRFRAPCGVAHPYSSSLSLCHSHPQEGQWATRLECGHCFHTECILEWVGQQLKSDLAGRRVSMRMQCTMHVAGP